MTEVKVIHGDGSKDILTHINSEIDRSLDKQEVSQMRVPRDEAADISLDEGEDRVILRTDSGTRLFGGILRNTVLSGVQTELDVESFERYAKDAEPSPPRQPYKKDPDSTIVEDAIESTPNIKKGNIETVESDVTILFSHATQALKIRLMRDVSKGELQYNADRTVDYVSSLGSDKTSTTISPANQNVTNFRVTHTGGKNVKTHLRVIGSGQTSVEVTASNFDPQSDREQWGRAYFKQVSNVDTLEKLGQKLVNDLQNKWTELEATVTELSPNLGDKFHVKYPEYNIDSNLRIVEMTEIRDSSGTHYDCAFSNRSLGRNQDVETKVNRVASESARTSSGNNQQQQPSLNIPMTKIPSDTSIDSKASAPFPGKLYLWSMGHGNENWSSDTGVKVQFVDNEGTVHFEQKASVFSSGSPLAVVDATDTGKMIALRIKNTSASDVTYSAWCSYTTEEIVK